MVLLFKEVGRVQAQTLLGLQPCSPSFRLQRLCCRAHSGQGLMSLLQLWLNKAAKPTARHHVLYHIHSVLYHIYIYGTKQSVYI